MKTKIFTKLLFLCSLILLLASCATKRGTANQYPRQKKKGECVAESSTKMFENGELVKANSYEGVLDLKDQKILLVDRATTPSEKPISLFDCRWGHHANTKEPFTRDTVISNEMYSSLLLGRIIEGIKPDQTEVICVNNRATDDDIAQIAKEYSVDIIISMVEMDILCSYFYDGYYRRTSDMIGQWDGHSISETTIVSGMSYTAHTLGFEGGVGYNTSWEIEWLNNDREVKIEQSYSSEVRDELLTSQSVSLARFAGDDFIKLVK